MGPRHHDRGHRNVRLALRAWKGRFYPAGCQSADWLDYYSQRFQTVEINNAFYRLPTREAFQAWQALGPEGFRVLREGKPLPHPRSPFE